MKKQMDTTAAAAETIMRRMPIMWWQMLSPTAEGQAEMNRMVAEKQKAVLDGMLAAQGQMMKEVFRFWTTPLTTTSSNQAGQRIMDAATAPARRTVNANVKRLRKG
jgi:hypothetical protein